MTIATHPAGTVCFAELQAPEIEAPARFYGALLGWTTAVAAGGPAGYAMFRSGDRDVVGLRPVSSEPRWVAYVKVASVDVTAARAAGLGATIVSAPSETPGVARTCLIADPEGAVIGLWEPRGIDGTALDTGPGSLWWVELATGNMAAARAFYAALFEWRLDHTTRFENGPHGYTLFKVGDRSAAGAFQFEPEWGMTPTWQVYFQVASFDATAAQACAMGGEQGFWRDAPNAGRIGVLVDPGGVSFLIAQPLVPAVNAGQISEVP
jgi:predicted enzyme related to lactoylglutathione lyase